MREDDDAVESKLVTSHVSGSVEFGWDIVFNVDDIPAPEPDPVPCEKLTIEELADLLHARLALRSDELGGMMQRVDHAIVCLEGLDLPE